MNKPEIYVKTHIDATVELSCYPFCDLSGHLLTGVTVQLPTPFQVLPGQTKESFVHSLAGSLIKIMVLTGELQRLPMVAKRHCLVSLYSRAMSSHSTIWQLGGTLAQGVDLKR